MTDRMAMATAERFVKSVVVIDNEAYIGQAPPSGAVHPLDLRLLAKAFADKGIVCSALSPDARESAADHIEGTAVSYLGMIRAADAAILDWQMRAEEGVDKTLLCRRLIQDIAEKEKGKTPRLILIYTGEAPKESMVEDLLQDIPLADGTTQEERPVMLPEEFGFSYNRLRVVFVKKENTRTPTDDAPAVEDGGKRSRPALALKAHSSCPPGELPQRVLEEFAHLTEGLLPNAVFNAIAAVRENTGALLALFGKELDPAFVHHLLLIPDIHDGIPYLHRQLRDLFHAVLHADTAISECITAENLNAWYNQSEYKEKKSFLHEIISEEDFKQILNSNSGGKKKAVKSLVANHEPTLLEFSRIHTVEKDARYPIYNNNELLFLHYGTIIYKDNNYYLCILPWCDCVRLEKTCKIPFIRMYRSGDKDKKLFVCLYHGDNIIELYISSKKYGRTLPPSRFFLTKNSRRLWPANAFFRPYRTIRNRLPRKTASRLIRLLRPCASSGWPNSRRRPCWKSTKKFLPICRVRAWMILNGCGSVRSKKVWTF